jgi:CBS domain-containing protein
MTDSTRKVNDLMTGHPIWIPGAARVDEASILARIENVHYLLVADRDKDLVGVACLCDLSRANADDRMATLAHSPPTYIMSGETVENAVAMMFRCSVGCLPVLEEPGQVIGILTRHDLVRAGFLELERGVTQCASCGATHNLTRDGNGVKFCQDCLECTPDKGTLEREFYCTLGGGD